MNEEMNLYMEEQAELVPPEVLEGEEYIPTQEEICDAIIYDLADNIGYMSEAQKSEVLKIARETEAALTPKERLYNEIVELQDRIQKLEAFIKKRDEDGVRMTEKLKITEAGLHLMFKQLELMKELNDVLVSRYSIFDFKKGE